MLAKIVNDSRGNLTPPPPHGEPEFFASKLAPTGVEALDHYFQKMTPKSRFPAFPRPHGNLCSDQK